MDTRTGTLKKPRLHSPAGPLTPTQVYIAPKDKSCLPREIWSHICLFTPPRALGNLLRVNKLFNTYLDPKSRFVMHEQPPPLNQSTAKPLDPNSIWRRARRAFWPKAPGPFKDMTELDIWRLACSTACQFCGKRPSRQQLPLSDPHRHGPGADGVAVIWEFRVRTCGACFSKKTSKVCFSAVLVDIVTIGRIMFSCMKIENVCTRPEIPNKFRKWTSFCQRRPPFSCQPCLLCLQTKIISSSPFVSLRRESFRRQRHYQNCSGRQM